MTQMPVTSRPLKINKLLKINKINKVLFTWRETSGTSMEKKLKYTKQKKKTRSYTKQKIFSLKQQNNVRTML